MHLKNKVIKKGKKKILSIDGVGIRGLIAVEILAKIEQELKEKGKITSTLSEYFDFVAGTSTGALIAAAISMGKSMDFIRSFYEESGEEMFERRTFVPNLAKLSGYEYSSKNLTDILQKVFKKGTTLVSRPRYPKVFVKCYVNTTRHAL